LPVIAISIDGHVAAAVRCDDFHVVNARVSGSLVESPFAVVELTASTHPAVGEGTYLTWLNELEISPGQLVTVNFVPEGETVGVGRTIEELFPEGDEREPSPEKSLEECFREVRAKPNLREHYSFRACTPLHDGLTSETVPGEYSFSFSVLWNWLRPARASVSLNTWTIDSVQFNAPSREHLREYIQVGQAAEFRVDA
jgi:hypothetical protein